MIFINFLKLLLSWQSTLDILLLTFALFFIYQTIRRLGTWKIVMGIAVAMTLFMAASLFDLKGIMWVFSNVSHVAVIGFIVLFQPEIRKILERFASPLRVQMGRQNQSLSEILSESAAVLAEQKRGALMVFPGKDPLDGILSGGFQLNAAPSIPILLSIFDPHSPGHDGAVIVEKSKLSRFGVRLPVSKSEKLPAEYGTRHFAAFGLSEISDALIFAVSEERGLITQFNGGELRTNLTKGEVKKAIEAHWTQTGSYLPELRKRKWYRMIGPELVSCFLLACFFWYSVVIGDAEIVEKVIPVSIQYVANPGDLALVGDKPSEAKVHLMGPKINLSSAELSRLSITVDLSEAKPGRQIFAISEKDMNLPPKVQMLDAIPSSLTLELVHMEERELPVTPQLVGILPEHLKIAAIKLNPKTVKAYVGIGRETSEEISVMTTPIYLESIKENTTIFCKLITPAGLQPVDKKFPDIEVSLFLEPRF